MASSAVKPIHKDRYRFGLCLVLLACVLFGFDPGQTLAQEGQPQQQTDPLHHLLPDSTLANAPGTTVTRAPEQIERLAEFMRGNAYQERVLAQWQRQGMEICGEPPLPGPLRHAGFYLLEPVTVQEGKPRSGVWLDQYRGVACGRERQFNFLFAADRYSLQVRHTLPGRTMAMPRLQMDTMRIVLPQLLARRPKCPALVPLDTEYLGPESNTPRAWREVWIFEACGELTTATLLFTPDDQGGTYFRLE
ncbi:MAG: hypothetical protein V3573_05460 [Desulfovibrionaceae bacterium]